MKVYLIKESDLELLAERLDFPEEKMKHDSRLTGTKEERTSRWYHYQIFRWINENVRNEK